VATDRIFSNAECWFLNPAFHARRSYRRLYRRVSVYHTTQPQGLTAAPLSPGSAVVWNVMTGRHTCSVRCLK
jgi:hypothetical protein